MTGNVVTPDFFRERDTRFVSGRTFAESARRGSLWGVVINEQFAREYFPGRDALGRTVSPYLTACRQRAGPDDCGRLPWPGSKSYYC